MREWLVDFLLNTFTLSPLRRWSPKEALQHSFISGKPPLDPQQKLNHERYLYHQRQKEQQQQQQLKHQQEAQRKHESSRKSIESFETSPLVDIASTRRTSKPADLHVSFAPPITSGALKPALKKTPC